MKMQLVVIFNPTTTRPYIQQHMSLQMLSNMEKKNYLTLIGFIKCFVYNIHISILLETLGIYLHGKGGGRKNVITMRENILTARQSESDLWANLCIFLPNHEASTAIDLTKTTSNDQHLWPIPP